MGAAPVEQAASKKVMSAAKRTMKERGCIYLNLKGIHTALVCDYQMVFAPGTNHQLFAMCAMTTFCLISPLWFPVNDKLYCGSKQYNRPQKRKNACLQADVHSSK